MKNGRFFLYLVATLAMVLSLTNTQSARAFLPRGESLAASTPPLLLNVGAIDLGGIHSCALTTGGGVKCWGRDGAPGDGITTNYITPKDVPGLLSGIEGISAGGMHNCALTSTGGVKCWGINWFGQLGDGTTTSHLTPVDVVGLPNNIIAVSAGNYHTCALTSDGGVKCWGANHNGQLGDGTTVQRLTPTDVFNLTNGIIAITTSGDHTCALTSDNGVKCWGENYHGQLGDGTTTERLEPTDVFLTEGVQAISAGYEHTCALTNGGGVKCWGRNQQGQLGDGTTTKRLIPTNVFGLASGIRSISAGRIHSCALTTGNGVKCWGYNRFGQLGDGTKISRAKPINVSGLTSGVNAITTGDWHTCALTSLSRVKCWGDNEYGQVGDGYTTMRLTPVNVVLLNNLIFFSNGDKDGYIRESSENSNTGLRVDTTKGTIYVGDDNLDRQYLAILSFNTSALPDTAVVFSALIQLHWVESAGNPYWSQMIVDIDKPFFGASASLLSEDFQAVPAAYYVGSFPLYPKDSYTYVTHLNARAFPFINLAGLTQLRVRCLKDDNDNMSADHNKLSSGNVEYIPNRPKLTIQYYVP